MQPMRTLLLFTIITFQAFVLLAQNKDEIAIRKMMTAQQAAWNRGDLAGFMKGYWENDSLLFVGKNGPTYGYANTLKNYQKGYPDKAHMGVFTSTIISMQPMGRGHYFVLGRWELKREVGDVSGYYTLVLQKIKGVWVIISDHSS